MPISSIPPHTFDACQRALEASQAEVVLLKLTVEKLTLQLLKARRAQFGSSSEQLDRQIALIECEPLDEQRSAEDAAKRKAANRDSVDRRLPGHLPREEHFYRPEASHALRDTAGQACGCTACGGRLRRIGQDVSEQLEYVPSRFKVIRHVRPKLACVACETIFQASAPSRPIARGMAGPGLLAHVLVSKYCDHAPLHRLSGIYAREGVDIDRSTMAGWVAQCEALLDPLVAALGRYVLAGEKVHADDTPVPVLEPGRGKTKTGRLWVYVRDDRPAASTDAPAAWYRYSPDRKGEHPQAHLARYRGILQADAYAGYGQIYASGRVLEAACWAHARRGFWDLYVDPKHVPGSIAEQALHRIAALYAVEAHIRGKPPDVRRCERQVRAGPLLDELHAWLTQTLERVSVRSNLAKAIGYVLDGAHALPRRRSHRDRQQCSRACAARRRARSQELPLHGLERRRRARRSRLQSGGDGQAQRARSAGLPARRARVHRRSPDQPHRRAATLELVPAAQERRAA